MINLITLQHDPSYISLSPAQKVVYTALIINALFSKEHCYPCTLGKLSALTNMSERHCQRVIGSLIQKQLLEKTQRANKSSLFRILGPWVGVTPRSPQGWSTGHPGVTPRSPLGVTPRSPSLKTFLTLDNTIDNTNRPQPIKYKKPESGVRTKGQESGSLKKTIYYEEDL